MVFLWFNLLDNVLKFIVLNIMLNKVVFVSKFVCIVLSFYFCIRSGNVML